MTQRSKARLFREYISCAVSNPPATSSIIDTMHKTIEKFGRSLTLDIVDTNGIEKTTGMRDLYVRSEGVANFTRFLTIFRQYREANGFLLLFDCTRPGTLEQAKRYYNLILEAKKAAWNPVVHYPSLRPQRCSV